MEKTTKRRLEELVAVGTGLNAAVDALVEDIRALERRLSDLRLAFDGKGAIPLDEEDDDVAADDGEPEAPVVERRLVYGQHEGVWRILVRCFEEDVDTGALRAMKSEDRPLLQCRRDVVIKAEETGALDELVDALTRGAERRLAALGRTPDQPQGWTAFNVSDAIERGERVSGRTAVPRGDDPDPF